MAEKFAATKFWLDESGVSHVSLNGLYIQRQERFYYIGNGVNRCSNMTCNSKDSQQCIDLYF